MPTPTAGTPALLSAPVPNPVPFTGAPNQQLLSGQYNSNFYALWNYATLLATALNGCNYIPGAAIGAVAATYPVTAAVGSCVSGGGATLSLGVAHGDYDDLANAQTITGTKTFNGGIAVTTITGTSASFTSGVAGSTGSFPNGVLGPGGGYAGPVYTAAGATLAATTHFVSGIDGMTVTATCGQGATCTISGGGFSFSGAASFTNSSSYQCEVSPAPDQSAASARGLFSLLRTSGTAVIASVINVSTSSIAAGTAVYAFFLCQGS